VFLLHRDQHLTYREIADVLQLSVKTVEIHMGHALTALRRSLAPWIAGVPR
jgi:RNA polymerase sigma-70 factor (ECF subfamily)